MTTLNNNINIEYNTDNMYSIHWKFRIYDPNDYIIEHIKDIMQKKKYGYICFVLCEASFIDTSCKDKVYYMDGFIQAHKRINADHLRENIYKHGVYTPKFPALSINETIKNCYKDKCYEAYHLGIVNEFNQSIEDFNKYKKEVTKLNPSLVWHYKLVPLNEIKKEPESD